MLGGGRHERQERHLQLSQLCYIVVRCGVVCGVYIIYVSVPLSIGIQVGPDMTEDH